MIVDATGGALPDRIEADLVIVGAGAAGIALALALKNSGLSVVLVEAGGDKFDRLQQDYYRAESVTPVIHGPVDMFRRRVLGGSTSIWGGRCIPFDSIDFEDRPWMSGARWPIAYEDVLSYYPRALEVAQAGAPEFDAGTALPGDPGPMFPGVASDEVILDRIERFSHPTNFGRWYRRQIADAPSIRLFTNAAVDRILTRDDGARTSGVRLRIGSERCVMVAAPRVVIAAGGIETARLLLASNDVRPAGLGNERDLVGRYYQCHLEGEIGRIAFHAPPRSVRMNYQRSHDGIYCRRYIWLSPEAQRRHQLAGLVLRPSHPNIVDPDHRDPVLSAMFLVKDRIVPEYARKMTALEQEARLARGGTSAGFYAAHLHNLVLGSPRLLAFSVDWLRRRVLAQRKLPSVVLENRSAVYTIDINGEQEPNRDSRILLGQERDHHGTPRVRIDWRTTAADGDRVITGLRLLQRAFAAAGTASIELTEADIEHWRSKPIPVGGHHIGTARMSDTPEFGVCDANCELFGTRGIFIAGAAAFPTSSFANPTLTLLALTLRMADHLKATARQAARAA